MECPQLCDYILVLGRGLKIILEINSFLLSKRKEERFFLMLAKRFSIRYKKNILECRIIFDHFKDEPYYYTYQIISNEVMRMLY